MPQNNDEILLRLDRRVDDLAVGQARIQENLKEHMRRTELAEKRIDKMHVEIQPALKHIHFIEGVLKLLGTLGAVAGIIGGIWKILNYINVI